MTVSPETAALQAPVLTCVLGGLTLGIETVFVGEVLPPMPVTPLLEPQPFVRGQIALRGELLPVCDLASLLSRTENAQISDAHLGHEQSSYVVLQRERDGQTARVAVAVEAVCDVLSLCWTRSENARSLVAGLALEGREVVQILHAPRLFEALPTQFHAASGREIASGRENLQLPARAFDAARSGAPDELAGHFEALRLASARVGGEFFGFDLRFVREFATLQNLARVPHGASHLLGLMNLRGEVLPVFDSRVILGLATRETSLVRGARGVAQVVVLEWNGAPLGLFVDEVVDVFSAETEAIGPPCAREDGVLCAVLNRKNHVVGVVDLPLVLGQF